MSFDLPLTAFALESSGTQPALGAVHTLTAPRASEDDGEAGGAMEADAALCMATSVRTGAPLPWITLTF